MTFSSAVQDRFEALVPALSKYGSVTVGLTLMVIGATGLYETLTEAAEPQVELAGAFARLQRLHHPSVGACAGRQAGLVVGLERHQARCTGGLRGVLDDRELVAHHTMLHRA